MSELRQNIATKEWYVIATERAGRPENFKKEKTIRDNRNFADDCPFCPGKEELLQKYTHIHPDEENWQVLSLPNKYSAFSLTGDRERVAQGIYRKMNGVGIHEVILESRRHNDHFVHMSYQHIEEIIKTYLNRFHFCMQDQRIEMVTIFKNYGAGAGSSMFHPHSQIIATPVVPTHIRFRLESAKRYFDDTGNCVYCDMLKEEEKDKVRIVSQNDSFTAFCPYASGAPFEVWMVPLKHNPDFGTIEEYEIKDLAKMLKDILCRYYYGLEDPDFNFAIRTPPRDESNDRSFHWYIKLIPKLTRTAGFEMATGMYINITLPEQNAEFLRKTSIPT